MYKGGGGGGGGAKGEGGGAKGGKGKGAEEGDEVKSSKGGTAVKVELPLHQNRSV